jgi:hypothetical protein
MDPLLSSEQYDQFMEYLEMDAREALSRAFAHLGLGHTLRMVIEEMNLVVNDPNATPENNEE